MFSVDPLLLAATLKKQLDKLDEKSTRKVVCLVTDDAANIKAARRLIISDPKYSHITSVR